MADKVIKLKVKRTPRLGKDGKKLKSFNPDLHVADGFSVVSEIEGVKCEHPGRDADEAWKLFLGDLKQHHPELLVSMMDEIGFVRDEASQLWKEVE